MLPTAPSSYRWQIFAAWLVIGGGFVALSLALPPGIARTTLGDLSLCILPLLANACLLSNSNAPYRRTNLFWILLAAGCGLWLIGSLARTYGELVQHQHSSFPYLGNIAYLLHPVPLMAAIVLQPHARRMRETLRYGLLDLSLLAIMWVYIYAFTTLPWVLVERNVELYTVRSWQSFIGESLVYMAGIVYVFSRTRGSWRGIYGQLLAISVIQTAGSIAVAAASLRGNYSTGSIYDLSFIVMFLWFGTIGLNAHRMTLAPDVTASTAVPGAQWPQRVAIIGVLFVPLLAAWNAFVSTAPAGVREFRLMLTLVALLIGSAMTFARQHLVDRERLRLVNSLQTSIENLKRLQNQFVQSEKLASLGQLAAGAAHEINNPLTAILGYSDMLTEEPSAGPRARNIAEKIREQARRTRELVNNLLSFARQVPAEKQLLDVNVILASAVQLRTLDLRDKRIRIETQNRTAIPAVRGDPNQLLQVFFQIISNAVDAMESTSGGVLTIRTERERGDVVIEFSDSGPGLKEPEKVFDPFYTTKAVGKGSGLGLSICYGIVQEHGGRITASNRIDGGALFRIELPAVLALFPQSRGVPAAALIER